MSERIILLVSVWLHEDRDVEGFAAFEGKIAAIQARYGGRIERSVRLTESGESENPFEVHVVSFPDQESLAAYRADDDIKALAAERERLIAKTVFLEGRDIEPYKPSSDYSS